MVVDTRLRYFKVCFTQASATSIQHQKEHSYKWNNADTLSIKNYVDKPAHIKNHVGLKFYKT